MAGRSAVETFLDAFFRVSGAIVLAMLAFVVWNVASRSPVRVLEDARLALRSTRGVLVGIATFAIGAIFATAAALVLLPALPNPQDEFASFELGTLLAGLALAFFIGDDIRAVFSRAR